MDNEVHNEELYHRACPTCLKRFQTATSMITHCAAQNSRCQVRYSDCFLKLVHNVSGGFIGVVDDGSDMRFVATKPTGFM